MSLTPELGSVQAGSGANKHAGVQTGLAKQTKAPGSRVQGPLPLAVAVTEKEGRTEARGLLEDIWKALSFLLALKGPWFSNAMPSPRGESERTGSF